MTETQDEGQPQDGSPVDAYAHTPGAVAAVAWLDTAIAEFYGALEECGERVNAGELELEPVQAKVNGVLMTMMSAAQEHTAAMQAPAPAATV
jgi:hypothetical protein